MKTIIGFIAVMTAVVRVTAGTVAATPPARSGLAAGGNSYNPIFSADGHHLVFVSQANNLVTNDSLNLWLDVFVRDLVTSNTVLVSLDASGSGGANADANYPSVSSDGQFIAFASHASNLVSGDTNDASDVFVRDVVAGTTRLVSVDVNGNAPVDSTSSIIPLAGNPMISADGRWVFFESRAINLVAGGAPADSVNIYRRDTLLNTTVLVTADTNGNAVGGTCELTGITPDGRYAAFITTSSGLAADVSATAATVYLRDVNLGTTVWVGYVPGVEERCVTALVSEDAKYVVFMTTGTSNAVVRCEVLSGSYVIGLFATNSTLSISADASRVAFESGGYAQLWTYDTNGATSPAAVFQSNASAKPVLSRDGQSLVFVEATSPAATQWQLYLYTSPTNIVPVSLNATGGPSAGGFFSSHVAVNGDGSRIALDSTASDLVPGDLNGASDIFLRDASATELVTQAQPSKPASTSFAHSFLGLNSISADGRFVVFTRYDDPSGYRDTNGWVDVYVTDLWSNTTVAVSINTNLSGGLPLVENTNQFRNPIISGDGSTIVATRQIQGVVPVQSASGGPPPLLAGIRSSNGDFTPSDWSVPYLGALYTNAYPSSLSVDGNICVFTDNSVVVLQRRITETNGLTTLSNYLISITRFGYAGGGSSNGILSPDERWVVFESTASNLTTNNADNPSGTPALFARDLQSNATHLIAPGNGGIILPYRKPFGAVVSGNSRFVAFASVSNYVMVHDLSTHATVVADSPLAHSPSLSYDGRYVAYAKGPLLIGNMPNVDQIYVRDLQGTQVDLVSANPSGAFGNRRATDPFISGDGRYVIFQSQASDLVADDTNGANDIFVRDRLLGVTMVVSANAQGQPGNGPSTRPVMAADGRTVVFQSFASDLVTGDYNDKRDLFVVKLGGADTDGDGLDDDWEMAYFNTLARDGSGDYDNDGATDLAEFRAATDPTNSNSIFRVLTVAPAGGGNTLVLWTGNPSLGYRAEFKDDLGAVNWTPITGAISWNGATASILDSTATNSAHRYYRVVRLP